MSEVTKKKENAVAAVNFEADAGQGLNMTQEDLALPFLKVLGQLSPECIRGTQNMSRRQNPA